MVSKPGDVLVLYYGDIEDYEQFEAEGGELGYHGTLHVVGHGSITRDKHYPYAARASTLAAANLYQLVDAMNIAVRDDPGRIYVAVDDGYSPSRIGASWNSNFYLNLDDDRLVATIEVVLADASKTPTDLDVMLRSLAARLDVEVVKLNTYLEHDGTQFGYEWSDALGRHGGDADEAARVAFNEEVVSGYGGTRSVGMVIGLDINDLAVGHLVEAAECLAAFLSVTGGKLPPDPSAVLAWLHSGHAELVVGLRESQWLEVKSAPFRLRDNGLSGTAQKIELAEDVARLVNGETDSLLLIGFAEAKTDGVATISAVRPVPLSMIDERQYANVIDERVFPVVQGLRIEVINVSEDKGLLAIYIPRQPAELLPYLVSGAVVGGKYQGDFFSIVQRRGEGTVTLGAREVHTYLVAGRAFLRGGPPIA